METIDEKVKRVIVIETEKLAKLGTEKKNCDCTLKGYFESITPEYTISPVDTIGKTIFLNTVRK